jgi:hypothetical protein
MTKVGRILILVLIGALWSAQTMQGRQTSGGATGSAPPGGIQLLPGYQHRATGGMESSRLSREPSTLVVEEAGCQRRFT